MEISECKGEMCQVDIRYNASLNINKRKVKSMCSSGINLSSRLPPTLLPCALPNLQ